MKWIGEHINEQTHPGLSVKIGRHSYGHPRILWEVADKNRRLTIGSFVSIAEGVKLFVGKFGRHPTELPSTFPIFMALGIKPPNYLHRTINRNLDLHIGSDVWIGRDATIFAGCTIGHGAVIGASSVVVKDVEPYSIVAGVPAKLIRFRFEPKHIADLLKLCWWEMDDDALRGIGDRFGNPNIESFLEAVKALRDQKTTSLGNHLDGLSTS